MSPIEPIDGGLMCLANQESGPICIDERWDALDAELELLEATALNFGRAAINDASVRENYVGKIRQMSQEILDDVRSGRATSEQGARFAHDLRNGIMDEARKHTSQLGKARAERMKAAGKTLEELVEEKVQFDEELLEFAEWIGKGF